MIVQATFKRLYPCNYNGTYKKIRIARPHPSTYRVYITSGQVQRKASRNDVQHVMAFWDDHVSDILRKRDDVTDLARVKK